MSKAKGVTIVVIGFILLWVAVSSAVFAFKNPSATETERFMHIPRSFVMDWEI